MVETYKGHYSYSSEVVSNWKSNAIGVYYCGFISSNGNLTVLYVGKGASDKGIRGRLLQHLDEDKWPDVAHFGYCTCSTPIEAETFEASEIKRLNPKYNILGKSY